MQAPLPKIPDLAVSRARLLVCLLVTAGPACATSEEPAPAAPEAATDTAPAVALGTLELERGRVQRVLDAPLMPGVDLSEQVDAAGALAARALGAQALGAEERLVRQRLQPLTGGGAIGVFDGEVEGLPVLDGRVRVLLDAEGRLQAWSADVGAEAALRGPDFALGPADAVEAAVLASSDTAASLDLGSPSRRADGWLDLPDGSGLLARPARVRAVAFPVDGGVLRRAWQVELWLVPPEGPGTESTLVELVIDGADGRVLRRRSLQWDLELRVWADTATEDLRPLDGPLEETTPHPSETPDGWWPEHVAPELVELDGFNVHADPWLAEGETETRGNHAETYADHSEPDGFSEGAGDFFAEMTADGSFDYTYDTSLSPTADEEQTKAAIVQAFTTVQWFHDWYYDSGFDELAGNAQASNFERGGLEADAMKVEVQDRVFSGGLNNANMSTPSDGEQPRMQIYVWSGRSEASLETDGGLTPEVGTASFGPGDFEVTADLAEVGSDTTACTGVDADVSGMIALIDRGDCLYVDKVRAAADAGAVGVVIVNHTPGDPAPSMGGSGAVSTPVLSVSYEDGESLRDALDLGAVEVSLYRESGPQVDGSLDNTVLAHEWGHYILARLTSCGTTQCSAIHEGWADFNALWLILREGEDLDGIYTPAAYAASGISEDAPYYGTRRVPYSRDPAFNALSFRHISDGEPLPSDLHPMAADSSPNYQSHNAGEVWASTMFDAYLALQEDGPDQGRSFEETRRLMTDIVVAGFVLAPAEPTWLELRDALLAAAATVSDPHDATVMAAAFAGRGMGSCAVGPERNSSDLTGIVEDSSLSGSLALDEPLLTDSWVSCDEDGWLDGGEGGELVFTVSNAGGLDLEGVGLSVTFEPEPAGLLFDSADLELDSLPAFTSTEVALPVVLDRHSAEALGETVVTVVLSHEEACEAEVSALAFARTETDVQAGVSSTDDFDADDGSWTIWGDDEGEIWERVDATALGGPEAEAELPAGDLVWLGADVAGVTDSALVSPAFTVAEALTVDLVHRFSFETSQETWWDGGVIELSVDGGDWTDVSAWTDPGYGGVLTDRADNPLGLREAFVGTNPSWPADDLLSLDLGEDLVGSTVQLRFRIGTDQASSDIGWILSEISLSGVAEPVFPGLIADETDCNPAPVADAGEDQTVTSGDFVSFDGGASQDPTGEPLTHSWELGGIEGPVIQEEARVSFTAPEVSETTEYTLVLTVSDGDLEASDEVLLTVEPVPPPEDTGDTGEGAGADGDDGDDAAPEAELMGCGCARGTSGALGLLLLPLGLLRRRS